MGHMQGHGSLFRAAKAYRKLKYSVIGESCQRICPFHRHLQEIEDLLHPS